MGMSSFVLTCEEVFVDAANAVVGECECVHELLENLEKNGHLRLLAHMSDGEKCEFVDELWNDFWSEKGHG